MTEEESASFYYVAGIYSCVACLDPCGIPLTYKGENGWAEYPGYSQSFPGKGGIEDYICRKCAYAFSKHVEREWAPYVIKYEYDIDKLFHAMKNELLTSFLTWILENRYSGTRKSISDRRSCNIRIEKGISTPLSRVNKSRRRGYNKWKD